LSPETGTRITTVKERRVSKKKKSASSRKNTTRPKGYAPWRPQRKTQVILAQVDAVLTEYRTYLPMTIRQVFYRMVAAFAFPKTEAAYERLCNYLNRARRARMIPFWMLRDDGASVMDHQHYDGEEDFYAHVRRQGEAYRQDKLANQPVDISVYCEAAGMMPQLHSALEDYSVPVFSCSGFDSTSAKYDLRTSCHDTVFYRGKRPVVLHLGDYDPSGESIFDVIREDVRAFLMEDMPHIEPERFVFERVALTPQLIAEHQLPTAPPKKTDSRSKRWSGGGTCQLEALPPDVLRHVLQEAVEGWLDLDILARDRAKEVETRRAIVKAIPGGTA
jgi:hypothetical protein